MFGWNRKSLKAGIAAAIIASSLGYLLRDCSQFASVEKDKVVVKKVEKAESIFQRQMNALSREQSEIPEHLVLQFQGLLDDLRTELRVIESLKVKSDEAVLRGDLQGALNLLFQAQLRHDSTIDYIMKSFKKMVMSTGPLQKLMPGEVQGVVYDIWMDIGKDLERDELALKAKTSKSR